MLVRKEGFSGTLDGRLAFTPEMTINKDGEPRTKMKVAINGFPIVDENGKDIMEGDYKKKASLWFTLSVKGRLAMLANKLNKGDFLTMQGFILPKAWYYQGELKQDIAFMPFKQADAIMVSGANGGAVTLEDHLIARDGKLPTIEDVEINEDTEELPF